jgi:DNA invertase Pin-like site-specific DNA recombinase
MANENESKADGLPDERKAVAYLRVSGLGQVDGDGFTRQRDAINARADALGLVVVDEYRDEGVSGTSGLGDRPGLSAVLERVMSNGVRVVLVEKADRLARDLIAGELILREFRNAGVRVVEAENGTDLTDGDESNPTATLIRQVLGAVAEFEKSALVAKLRAARERMRRETGRCEGPKPYPEDVVRTIKRLRRKNPATGKVRGYGEIARELDRLGIPTKSGKPWHRGTVASILEREGFGKR